MDRNRIGVRAAHLAMQIAVSELARDLYSRMPDGDADMARVRERAIGTAATTEFPDDPIEEAEATRNLAMEIVGNMLR